MSIFLPQEKSCDNYCKYSVNGANDFPRKFFSCPKALVSCVFFIANARLHVRSVPLAIAVVWANERGTRVVLTRTDNFAVVSINI